MIRSERKYGCCIDSITVPGIFPRRIGCPIDDYIYISITSKTTLLMLSSVLFF